VPVSANPSKLPISFDSETALRGRVQKNLEQKEADFDTCAMILPIEETWFSASYGAAPGGAAFF
jgi:hypothetical protein